MTRFNGLMMGTAALGFALVLGAASLQAGDSKASHHFGALDDATLTTDLSAQGYVNARDFERTDKEIWLNADRDGQPVRIAVMPFTLPESTQVGGTSDADGGDGGSSSTAEGGSAEGIGDAGGSAGGDGGSPSMIAEEDAAPYKTHVEAAGYANPRDYMRSGETVWVLADKDGQPVYLYLVPGDAQ